MLKKLMGMHRQQEIANENSIHTIILKHKVKHDVQKKLEKVSCRKF